MENKDQNNTLVTGSALDGADMSLGAVKEPPPDPNALSLDPSTEKPLISQEQQPKGKANVFLHFARRLDVMLAVLLLIAGAVVVFSVTRNRSNENANTSSSPTSSFGTVSVPLDDLIAGKDLSLAGTANVTINGPIQLNNGLYVAPTLQPTGARAGQIYYDRDTNQLAYFNGEQFVFLTSPGQTAAGLQSLGGATGAVTLGGGLSVAGNQLSNTGVLSVQGQSGDVTLTAGPGIIINGTSFSNDGVISIASGSPNVSVTDDGNGNISLAVTSGSGTITSSGGTAGRVPLFTASQNIENSIITQSGLTVTISGDLSVVTGGLTLSNALTVSNGGTGASSFSNNGVLVGNGTAAVTAVAAGGSGLCLLSTAGAPAWGACPSGSGVTSLNSLTGALNLANASAAGSTITIDDASDTNKGIASFNSTNFNVTSGAVNTVQDINSGATPTFAGVNTNNITPSAALTVGISAQTALLQGSTTTITSNGAGNNIVLNSAASIELQDNTNVTGNLGVSGDIAANGGDITSSGALNITPGGALTIGSSSQALTLQGGATSTFRATSGANTTIVAFTSPTANTTLNFPALAAGTYTICTTSGNCAGAAITLQGAYDNSTSPEITLDATRGALTIRDNSTPLGANLLEVQNNLGSVTYLAVTSAGAAVTGTITASGNVNSGAGAIQTNGTTRIDNTGNLVNIAAVTASGSATFQGGTATLGTNAQAGSVVLNDGSSNSGTLQVAALGQNTIYTLPDPGVGSATICLTTGNCAGTGGGVTTPGGTADRLAKFTSGQAIADSTITDDGTTVTTSVNIVIQGGTATLGVAGIQGGSLVLAYSGGAFTGTLATDTLTANQSYTLPNASGTFCLTSGNCAGVGGTGDILQGGNNFGTAVTIGTNDNFALNFETNGTNRMTIAADGSSATLAANMDLFLQGTTAYISNAQGQTNSEAIGLNATASGANAVAVGNGAVAVANAVAIGRAAGASSGAFGGPVSIGDGANAGAWGVAIGQNTAISGNNSVAIGNGTGASQDAVALGMGADADQNGIALGYGATTDGNNRIVIGRNATATADFQLVIGSNSNPINNAYIGNGVTSTTPEDTTIHATGASGTNVSGGDLNLAAGASTGNAAGGDLNFQVSAPGASGGSVNVPATVASLTGSTGAALFKNLVNSASAFDVQTAGGASVFSINTLTNGATLAGDLAVNGGDLTSTGALNITPGGTLTVGVAGQQLVLQGSANTRLVANGDGFTTTVGFNGTATANVTYNFDRTVAAGTYSICTTIGNCAGTGGGVTTSGGTTGALAKFTGPQTLGDSLLSETGSTVTVNGNLNLVTGNQFQVNGTQISSANLSNDANLAKLSASQTFTGNTVAFQNGTNSTNAFNIQNQGGNRILTADSTGGQIVLGTSSALDGKLVFNNMSNANTVTILPGVPTGNRTLTLPDVSGIICTDAGNCAGAGSTLQTGYNFSVGGTTPKIKVNSTLLGVDIQDADTTIGANLFNIRASNGAGLGSVMFGVGSTGAVTLQNSANSTTAFRLLTQGGTSVLTGDTQNGAIILGQSGTLSGSLIFNNSSNANTTTIALTAPTANHTITLPNATGTVCLSSGNCSGSGSSNTLQAAYDAGNTITTSTARDIIFNMADTATDANFLVDLQCDTSCGANGRFAIQDDGTDVFAISPTGTIAIQPTVASTTAVNLKTTLNNNLFTIDTTNSRIGINLGGNNLPTLANTEPGLHLSGVMRISGGGLDSYTTPLGVGVAAKINIENQNLPNFGQIMAMGLSSTSNASARALSLFDARTVRHQPTLAVFNTDESSSVGFSWNGSNTTASVQTNDSDNSNTKGVILQSGNVTASNNNSGDVQVNTGSVAGSGTSTGNIYVVSGDGVGTNTSSGNVIVDVGANTGSGTRGNVNIGVTNGLSVNIGRTAGTTTLQGGTTNITGTLNANGNVTLGDAATDLVTITGVLQGANALVFEGSIADANETTFAITNPTADRTVTFGDESGTVCLQGSANCGFATGTVNSYIQNSTGGPQVANFNIISAAAGSIAARIEGAANMSAQALLVKGGSSPTANAFEVQNSSNIQVFGVDTANSRVTVGSGGSCTGRLCVGQSVTGTGSATSTNMYNVQTVTVTGGTPTVVGQQIVITDTSVAQNTTIKPLVIDTSASTNASAIINSIDVTVPTNASGNFLAFKNGSTTTLNVANGGAMQIQTASNSTSAFRVQDASSNTLLNIDTTNGWVINNGSTAPNNLLESPSFEANGSFTSTGWNFDSQGSISSAGTPHHGKYEFIYNANGALHILSSYKYLSVQPGDQHYAEVWYKGSGLNVGAAASFSFSYYDKDKVNIGSSSVTNFDRTNTSYTLATVTGTAPAGTVYMRLSTGVNASSTTGSWYFDDYTLTKMNISAPQVFKNNVNSSSAFQVQTASGAELMNIDSTNSIISLLGNNTGHLPTFTTGTNLSAGRWGGASVVLNGYVYVIGGSSTSFCTASNTVQYAKLNADGSMGAWGTTTVLPGSFCEPGAATYNGYIYAQGESSGTIYRAKPDVATGLISGWTSLTPTGASTGGNIKLAAYNGYLYELNINSPTINYAKINSDGTIGTFSTMANWFSGSSRRSAGIAFANGYFYSVGGAATGAGDTTVYYAKVNSDGTFAAAATTTALPNTRAYLGVTVANGYIYAMGGGNGTTEQNTIYYAPLGATGTIGGWTQDTTTLTAPMDSMGVAQHNGYIYVLGGWNGSVATNTTSYTSTPRVRVGGSLDLLSYGGENNTEGGTGGSLTAGNTNLVGSLNVADQATFRSGVSVQGGMSVAGELNAGSFSGAGLTNCNSINSKLLYDATTKQFSCGTDKPNVIANKPSDQTSTNAFTSDSTYTFAMAANETWVYTINAAYAITGDTQDVTFRVNAPASSTCRLDISNLYNVWNTTTSVCGGSVDIRHWAGSADTNDQQYTIWGTITTGANPGSMQLQWMRQDGTGSVIARAKGTMMAYKLTGVDLAEAYYTDDASITPGTVVALGDGAVASVKKTTGTYDSHALGVVSTAPGHILGDPNRPIGAGERPVLLALSGRIPVRVSLENGPILPGDYLTTSSTPGVAMKATRPGQMIGKALEGFNSANPDAQGSVMTFANLTYADPSTGTTANNDLQNGTYSNLNVAGMTTTKDLRVTGKAEINELIVGTMSTNNLKVKGSMAVSGDINFDGVGKSRNAITKKFVASKYIPIGSVVIADPINDGQVTSTTVMADTRVLGVALTEAEAGEEVTVAIGGSVQVMSADAGMIQGGDLMVSSSQEGLAEKSMAPLPGSMVGKALGRSDDGRLVWILVSLH